MVEIDGAMLRAWPLPLPEPQADKTGRGHVIVVAGSAEMPGAAWLSATAALRAGAGKLVVATAKSVAPGLALRLPEARVIGLDETPAGGFTAESVATLEPVLKVADGAVVGPGLQDDASTRAFVAALLDKGPAPEIVLDALAMKAVLDRGRFERPVVLTPHAGEMAGLMGLDKAEVEAESARCACEAAARWNAVVVLKGATTTIADPGGEAWRHRGGNVGLAISGSGDTLAGVIGGLLARGAPLVQAAAWGVALHARAGDALARRLGPLGYLASELPAEVPALMHRLSEA